MSLLWPPVVGGALLLLAIIAFATTTEGAIAVTDLDAFLEFYVGVFALLALTASVVWGLIANNRFFLRIGHRIFAQAVHRVFSVASVGFLLIHIFVKIADGHAMITDAAIPFLSHTGPYARPGIYVGLGTTAGDLMILVLITGIVRGRFAGKRRPWLWRFLHCLAYISWPIAMVHGLEAGRAAKAWVNWSYISCGALVAVALLVRLFAMWFKQLSASREAAAMTAKTATIKPGSGVEFARVDPPSARSTNRRPLATVPDLSPRAAAAGLGLRDDDPLDPARRGLDPRDPDYPGRRGYDPDEAPAARKGPFPPTYDDPRFDDLRGDPVPTGYDDRTRDDDRPVSPGGGYDSRPVSTGGYDDRSVSAGGYDDRPVSAGGYDDRPVSAGGYDDRPATGGRHGYGDRPAAAARGGSRGGYGDRGERDDRDRPAPAYGEDGYTTDPLPTVLPWRQSRRSEPEEAERPAARRKKPHTWVPTAPTSPAPAPPLRPVEPTRPAEPTRSARPVEPARSVEPLRPVEPVRAPAPRQLDPDDLPDTGEQTKEHRWVPVGTPRGTAVVPEDTPTATFRRRPESARDRYRRANGMEPVPDRSRRGASGAPEPARHGADRYDRTERSERPERAGRRRRHDDTMTGTAQMRRIPRHIPDDDAGFLDAVPGPREEPQRWNDPVLSGDLPAPDDLPPAATVAASEMPDEDFWSLIRGGPRK